MFARFTLLPPLALSTCLAFTGCGKVDESVPENHDAGIENTVFPQPEPPLQDICQVMWDNDFYLDADPKGREVLQPSPGSLGLSERYLRICRMNRRSIEKAAELDPRRPALWRPSHMKLVANYTRRHGLKSMAVAPSSGGVRNPGQVLKVSGDTVYIGMSSIGFVHDHNLLFILDHEYGHTLDDRILFLEHPELKRSFHSETISKQRAVDEIKAWLDLVDKKVDAKDRERFETLKSKFFQDLEHASLQTIQSLFETLPEIFRFGQESYDARLKPFAMSEDMSHFKKGWNAGLNDEFIKNYTYPLTMAQLQEAGLWEEFTRQSFYDPFQAKYIDPERVEFFRIAIRASAHYFQKQIKTPTHSPSE